MSFFIWYDMIWYDMIWYDMIYLLTAIGLTSGGSSTVHIYIQTIHRTTQWTQTIHRTTQLTNCEEWGPCPVFVRCTLAFALQLREKHVTACGQRRQFGLLVRTLKDTWTVWGKIRTVEDLELSSPIHALELFRVISPFKFGLKILTLTLNIGRWQHQPISVLKYETAGGNSRNEDNQSNTQNICYTTQL